MSKNIVISGIEANVYDQNYEKGIIVYSHGLFSSKDAYKINKLESEFNKIGYGVITFSYGYTKNIKLNKPLEIKIEECINELNKVIEYTANTYNISIHLVGSSIGGAIAMYYVGMVPYIYDIKSLNLIAAPSNLKSLVKKIINGDSETLKNHNEYVKIGDYKISLKSLNELEKIDLIEIIPRIDVPVNIIHGEHDEVVPVEQAIEIKNNLCSPHNIKIIPDGDHSLTSEKHINLLFDYIHDWLKRNP